MMKILFRAIALLGLAVGLAACGSRGNSVDPPTTVTAIAGDGQVQLSWPGDPSVDWWVFYAPNPAMTLDNWTTISGSRALQRSTSPRMITGLTNGTSYTFIINGRTNGGKGGDGSVPVFATPRAGGDNWTTQSPLGTGAINGLIFSTTQFVAVGSGGALFTSPDGITWTARDSGTTNDLYAVSYNSNRYVAVGAAGTILYSLDGASWTTEAVVAATNLRALTPSGDGFIAVGDGGTIIRSGNGQNWDVPSSGTTQNLRGISKAVDTFVAVGDGGTILRSTNTVDWTAVPTTLTGNLKAVSYLTAAARLVTVGSGGTIAYSDDRSASWARVGAITTTDLNALVAGSRFVSVGATGAIVRSDDGITWASATSGSTVDLNSVAWGAGVFPAGGATGGTLLLSK